jgi:nucleoside-diphosphate-sugar epimerase
LAGAPAIESLLARGDEVRALIPAEAPEPLSERPRLEILHGHLTEPDTVGEAVDGVDVVFDLGMRLGGDGWEGPASDAVEGRLQLLDTCAAEEVRRVVFLSSVAVYSPAPVPEMWPITEDARLEPHGADDLEHFGVINIDIEDALRDIQRAEGVEFVVLRTSAIYAPGARWLERLIVQLTRRPWQAWWTNGHGPGMQWVHARDVAEALVLAGTSRRAANTVFNVAGPEVITEGDVLRELWRTEIGFAEGAWEDEDEPGDLKYALDRAEAMLGFIPRVMLREGLREVLDAMSYGGMLPGGRRAWEGVP